MKVNISPSIMCCKAADIEPFLESFEKHSVHSIHFDVMDGHYVDNIMLGTNLYKELSSKTAIPIDMHLMTYQPERFVELFQPKKGDRVCFHPETTRNPYQLLQSIRERGCLAGIVLNPGSSIGVIEELYDQLDYVMLMTVNPGFAGQKVVPNAYQKIRRTKELLDRLKPEIEIFVDGNTTFDNARQMVKAGASGVVAGTSSILGSLANFDKDYHRYLDFIKGKERKVS